LRQHRQRRVVVRQSPPHHSVALRTLRQHRQRRVVERQSQHHQRRMVALRSQHHRLVGARQTSRQHRQRQAVERQVLVSVLAELRQALLEALHRSPSGPTNRPILVVAMLAMPDSSPKVEARVLMPAPQRVQRRQLVVAARSQHRPHPAEHRSPHRHSVALQTSHQHRKRLAVGRRIQHRPHRVAGRRSQRWLHRGAERRSQHRPHWVAGRRSQRPHLVAGRRIQHRHPAAELRSHHHPMAELRSRQQPPAERRSHQRLPAELQTWRQHLPVERQNQRARLMAERQTSNSRPVADRRSHHQPAVERRSYHLLRPEGHRTYRLPQRRTCLPGPPQTLRQAGPRRQVQGPPVLRMPRQPETKVRKDRQPQRAATTEHCALASATRSHRTERQRSEPSPEAWAQGSRSKAPHRIHPCHHRRTGRPHQLA